MNAIVGRENSKQCSVTSYILDRSTIGCYCRCAGHLQSFHRKNDMLRREARGSGGKDSPYVQKQKVRYDLMIDTLHSKKVGADPGLPTQTNPLILSSFRTHASESD